MAFEMVLGWFGISTVWLLPLVWRYVTRALAGERDFLKGRGTVRLWLVTLVALSASAALEALTSGADPQDKAGGAAGRALSSLFSHMLGWTGAFLLMLGVLIWVAPMVFGRSWGQVLNRRRSVHTETSAEPETRHDEPVDDGLKPTALGLGGAGEARWSGNTGAAQPAMRHRGIEAVSARRQPAWQPPPRRASWRDRCRETSAPAATWPISTSKWASERSLPARLRSRA